MNTTNDLVYLSKSGIDLIQNVTVYDISSTVLHLLESNISVIDKINMHKVDKSIHAKESSIGMMQNSHTHHCGSADMLYGGAIYFENSNSTVFNLTLDHNTAQTGGAMHISCDTFDICQNIIYSSTFSNNTAVEQGGAINYDFRRPELSNITFDNNQAPYGPNIASYPVRIVNSTMINDSMVLTNVASGIAYHETIKMLLVDYDNQTMNLVDGNQIKILPLTNGATLQGVDYAILVDGEAKFDNLKFIYAPGKININYIATCDLIDSNKVSYLSLQTNNLIDVSFRYCQPGEVVINNQTCSE